MEIVASAEPVLHILERLGFPIWAAVVFWAAIKISHAVTAGLNDLKARDAELQRAMIAQGTQLQNAMNDHISKADIRIALIEQLLKRHDDSIEAIWTRFDQHNGSPRR